DVISAPLPRFEQALIHQRLKRQRHRVPRDAERRRQPPGRGRDVSGREPPGGDGALQRVANLRLQAPPVVPLDRKHELAHWLIRNREIWRYSILFTPGYSSLDRRNPELQSLMSRSPRCTTFQTA